MYVSDSGNHRIQVLGALGMVPTQTTSWGRIKALYR
jgi:hypothetical protein